MSKVLYLCLFLSVIIASAQTIGQIEKVDCFLEECSFVKEYPKTEFGYITVPENYDLPEGKKIKVAYCILKTKNPDFDGDPIIIFQGGWGVSEVFQASWYVNSSLLNQRDIILYDYRGSGFSTALPCSDLGKEAWIDLKSAMPYAEVSARITRRYKNCIEILEAQGIDYNNYGMINLARDAAFLAQQLPYNNYNLFGVSYGTMAIQHFLRAAELYNFNVRSAVLDSNVPISIPFNGSMSMSYEGSLINVLNDCKNQPDCNEAYPDLQNRFIQFLNSLEEQPLEVKSLDGSLGYLNKEEVNAIIHQMLYSYQLYPVIPILLEAFISREKLSLGVLINSMQENVEMGFNILGLIEYNYDHKGTVVASKQLFEESEQNLKPYALVDSYWEFYVNDTLIKMDSIATTPIKSSVPSLLMAGSYDPITPPELTQELSKNFSNHLYFELPKVGHGATSHPCGEKIMKAFLNDPLSTINADCIKTSSFEIDFTTSCYKNPYIFKLLKTTYLDRDPFLLAVVIISIVGILISGILSLIKLFKKKNTDIHMPLFLSSIIAILFISGLVYFTLQTMATHSFLLLFGLTETSAYVFWLVPILLITFVWFAIRFYKAKPMSKWYFAYVLCFLILFGIIGYYQLFPPF